jgi:hypothetical protein
MAQELALFKVKYRKNKNSKHAQHRTVHTYRHVNSTIDGTHWPECSPTRPGKTYRDRKALCAEDPNDKAVQLVRSLPSRFIIIFVHTRTSDLDVAIQSSAGGGAQCRV